MEKTNFKTSAPVIYSHTALRGIAAMYVVIFHLLGGHLDDIHKMNALSKFFQWGAYPVDLFFILSGFILNWVYISTVAPVNWQSYLRARVGRIAPLYYLTTFLSLPLLIYSMAKYGDTYLGKDYCANFPLNLILNVSLVSGITSGYYHTFNAPAWSISVEFFCYLAVFPLLVYTKKFLTAKPYDLLSSVILAGIFTYCGVACYNMAPIPIYHWNWDSTFLTRGIFGFSSGFFLCSIFRKSSDCGLKTYVINLVIATSIALFLLIRFDLLPSGLMLYNLPFLVFVTAMDKGILANLFKMKLFQWLGERSYSIYLWHALCLGEFSIFLHLHKYLPISIYDIVIVGFILFISELSYRYFECPAREIIRKRGLKLNSNAGA